MDIINNNTSKESAEAWLRTVVGKHLSSTARTYKRQILNGEASHSSALGFQFDPKPFEGKVVDENETWLLVKEGRKSIFLVILKTILDNVPKPGNKVRITPYARKRFDGERLDAPVNVDISRGYTCSTYILGERVSKLPVDKETLNTVYLSQMVEQLEVLPAPDGVRTITQMLIDAGANREPMQINDPTMSAMSKDNLPYIMFRVSTMKHDGYVKMLYIVGADVYSMQALDMDKNVIDEKEQVYFDDLGIIIQEMVDDGQWKIAKVEILGKSPSRKSAA